VVGALVVSGDRHAWKAILAKPTAIGGRLTGTTKGVVGLPIERHHAAGSFSVNVGAHSGNRIGKRIVDTQLRRAPGVRWGCFRVDSRKLL
jgi:hypothetical protein